MIESEGYMPRCLGSTQGTFEGIFFDWHSNDRYSKGIQYLNLGKLQNLLEHLILEGSAEMGSRAGRILILRIPCCSRTRE